MKDIYFWMGRVTTVSFKVMGNFPRREYELNEKESLEDLGLYPNAMLHIQAKSQ